MSNSVSFGNDILAASGKKGHIKPIAGSEYYMMNAGELNKPLRRGHKYAINDYIKECMHPDSDLQRRISRGELYAELGHPQPYYFEKINGQVVRTPITQAYEWVMRLRTIDMANVCAHIRALHFDYVNDQSPLYLRAEITPYGNNKHYVIDALRVDSINMALSMRTITAPQKPGVDRQMEYFAGVDLVFEPGADSACKHKTDGIESLMENAIYTGQERHIIVDMEEVLDAWEQHKNEVGIIERIGGLEAFTGVESMMDHLKARYKASQKKVELINQGSFSLF